MKTLESNLPLLAKYYEAVFVLLCGYFIQAKFNLALESPYMDEEFHVPQAIKFCNSDFTADSKITTPPGLYYFFAALHKIFSIPPNSASLRNFNSAICIPLMFISIKMTINKLHEGTPVQARYLRYLRVFLLPSIFFYHFLFYTDSLSLLLCSLAILLHLRENDHFASCAVLAACYLRQTNIVLFGLLAGFKAVNGFYLEPNFGKFLKNCLKNIFLDLLFTLGFLYWLLQRGTLAQGDQEHHRAMLHLQQLAYLTIFTIPFVNFDIWKPRRSNFSQGCLLSLFTFVTFAGFGNFPYFHPYLLSDNRHLTFYLLRYFIRINGFVTIPVALGLFLGFTNFFPFLRELLQSKKGEKSPNFEDEDFNLNGKILMKLIIALLVVAFSVVPLSLVEFRYFALPLYLVSIFQPVKSKRIELFGLVVNASVSYYLIQLFLENPFTDRNGQLQRFML
eukprot:GHVP01053717.1.p1 GENE.GHVP01053717.1~~GHVP01053717.1.p1  ORF type:complete len:448 (+),score=35.98 GHVP01053717.1:32-1375(+)